MDPISAKKLVDHSRKCGSHRFKYHRESTEWQEEFVCLGCKKTIRVILKRKPKAA